MGRIGVSHWLRLIAPPALLLAIAYATCIVPAADVARERVASVSNQPYAYSSSNRAKAVRPARVQARVPKTPGPDGKTDDSESGFSVLARSGQLIQVAHRAATARVATNNALDPLRLRTRNPRDPPAA